MISSKSKTIKVTPEETMRQAVLAFCLEPLADKEGLTTRHVDISEEKKLIYFITAGINAAWPFYQLAERILKKKSQPRVIYDLEYEAIRRSILSRAGKIVNFGLLEAMFPVVAVRLLYTKKSGPQALEELSLFFQNTSADDARYHDLTRRFAWARSTKGHKRQFKPIKAKNMVEYYGGISFAFEYILGS